jgi:integrase
MARLENLTDRKIERQVLPADGKRKELRDPQTPGLFIKITSTGVKTWMLDYAVFGQRKRKKLGDAKLMNVGAAQEKARSYLKLAISGVDPFEEEQKLLEKQEADQRRDKDQTFALLVDKFVEKHAMGKKQNRTWKEQKRNLLAYAPAWHDRPVSSVSRAKIQDVLDGLMSQDKGTMANRVYAAYKTFFKWCFKREIISRNPMDLIERPFDGERRREVIFTDQQLSTIWSAADEIGGVKGDYLKVIMLTGHRRTAVANMRWDELDLDGAVWKCPASSEKNKQAHDYPLSALSVEVLETINVIDGNPYVFTARTIEPKPFNGTSTLQRVVKEKTGFDDFKFHTFRHTFITFMSRAGISADIRKACVNHKSQDVTEGYSHHDYFAEQRTVFNRWGAHVASLIGDDHVDNVVAIGVVQ